MDFFSLMSAMDRMLGFLSSWLPGRAKTRFTQHEQPLLVRDGKNRLETLPDFCKAATPPCYLNSWLFNGHLQTLWTVLKDRDIPIYYKRVVFQADELEYTGCFAVDFTVPAFNEHGGSLPPRTAFFSKEEEASLGSDDKKPMVIVLHGLSGGSHEAYLRSVIEPLIAADWECCVVNSRGCAMSQVTSPMLYNARATWDVRQFVKWARRRWPQRRMYGLGFSLGANILTNVNESLIGCQGGPPAAYLADETSTSRKRAAPACLTRP